MRAFQALGEEYVVGKLAGLGGAELKAAQDALREEARAKIAPLKEGLSPKVYAGFVADGYSADQMHDYMVYEKEKKDKEAKAKEEKLYAAQVEAAKKSSLERFDGDGFGDRLGQGLLRVGSELDVVTDYLNPLKEGKSDPETVGYLLAQEEVSQAFKDKNRTPEQIATAKKHEKEFIDANTTVETVVGGAKVLYDTVSNPSEWDMAGVLAEFANPVNLVGGGAGHVAGKVATSAATKAAVGAATGAVVEGGVNAGYEYASAKGQNKSDEEARKAAVLGGAMGVAIGVPTGAVGGVLAKTSKGPGVKETSTNETTKLDLLTEEQVKEQIALPDSLANSTLLKVEEVQSHSDQASDAITQISAKVTDPVLRDAEIAKRLPPTQIEADYTLHINNGKPVSARLAGARVREALKKSIASGVQSVEVLDKKLLDAGFDAQSREAITTAYVNKDMSIYDAYVGKKYAEAEKGKANDVTRTNMQTNTTGEVTRSDSSTLGAGETDTQNPKPTDVPKFSREYTEAKQSTGLDAGGGDTQNGLPQVDATVDRQPTSTNDGAGVPQRAGNEVVPGQDVIQTKPTVATFDKDTLSVNYRNGVIKKGGHRNWRNNNPGNLEYGDFAKSHGAIGSDGRFAIFPDMDNGYEAQASLLHSKNYKNLTLQQAIYRYAPQFENDSGAYVRAVSKNAGISRDAVMKDLSPSQLEQVVKAMSRHEGMKEGEIIGGRVAPVVDNTADIADVARVTDDVLDDADIVALKDTPLLEPDDSGEVPGGRVGDAEVVEFTLKEYPQREEAIDTLLNSKEQRKATYDVSETIDEPVLEVLNFKHDSPVIRVMNNSDIKHIFKKHGDATSEAKRGLIAINKRDIANYPEMVQHADFQTILTQKNGKRKMVSMKQYDDHYVVVEEISTKKNTLNLKSMYKKKGVLDEKSIDHVLKDESHLFTSRNDTVAYTVENMPSSTKSIAKTRKDVKTTIDEIETDAYVRAYDDAKIEDVAGAVDEVLVDNNTKKVESTRKVFDDVLGDESIKLDANQELELSHIDDPMVRHRKRKELERKALKGEELKAWEKENLDSRGNIREVGEC